MTERSETQVQMHGPSKLGKRFTSWQLAFLRLIDFSSPFTQSNVITGSLIYEKFMGNLRDERGELPESSSVILEVSWGQRNWSF